MSFLYNTVAAAIYLAVYIASFFNKKAKEWIKGRKGLLSKLKTEFKDNKAPVMWMHCSSLGEFEQGRDIIYKFKKNHPEYKIVLSFYSPSGYNYVANNYTGADTIIYLPLDTKGNAKKFIDLVKPKIVFWIKYEYWANILAELKKNKIPVYLISAIFRPNQLFFKPYGGVYRKILHSFEHLFVQNKQSEQLLNKHGIYNVTVVGDTRFDRVTKIAKENVQFGIIEAFTKNSKCLILGSSWPKDETLVAKASEQFSDIKLLVVPHEVTELHLINIEREFSHYKSVRYSLATNEEIADYNMLIVDTMGMLSHIYKYAQIAYIGCGFNDGIHNIIEAAVYGMPIVFGPNYNDFREAVDLIELGAATSIKTSEELLFLVNLLFTNEQERCRRAQIARDYVVASVGSIDTILNKIDSTDI